MTVERRKILRAENKSLSHRTLLLRVTGHDSTTCAVGLPMPSTLSYKPEIARSLAFIPRPRFYEPWRCVSALPSSSFCMPCIQIQAWGETRANSPKSVLPTGSNQHMEGEGRQTRRCSSRIRIRLRKGYTLLRIRERITASHCAKNDEEGRTHPVDREEGTLKLHSSKSSKF